MPPRQRALPTDFDSRLARLVAADGRQALGGMSRVGSGRGKGRGNQSVLVDAAAATVAQGAQLLVMSATSDSIAAAGDHVTFDAILGQHDFATVVAPGRSWVHPISGVYMLVCEVGWDTYQGGGIVGLELDGLISADRILFAGDVGQHGDGVISYYAAAGAVGRIRINHGDDVAHTCDVTVRISLPDPVQAERPLPAGFTSVILYIDGVEVASASGDLGTTFSTATVYAGQGLSEAASSEFVFDDVELLRAGSNMLANSGFESAMLAPTGTVPTPTATGNWQPFAIAGAAPVRTTSPVHAGTYACHVDSPGDGYANRYVYQDIDLAPGDHFDVNGRVRPVSGSQDMGVLFDWDRAAGGTVTRAVVRMTPTATTFDAFGLSGSGPALPADDWSLITLRVGVTA